MTWLTISFKYGGRVTVVVSHAFPSLGARISLISAVGCTVQHRAVEIQAEWQHVEYFNNGTFGTEERVLMSVLSSEFLDVEQALTLEMRKRIMNV
ncbi:unnamed protein product [Sphenostylis stenocarpa]|uniref:Uncharacterized protein n=1 Tax=Sphenostylis stenocarpa TaxID=92480 RepID=A0AA86SAV5_9FABA|nr:unnamed protein product [Sphenostylis stenocarpa]